VADSGSRRIFEGKRGLNSEKKKRGGNRLPRDSQIRKWVPKRKKGEDLYETTDREGRGGDSFHPASSCMDKPSWAQNASANISMEKVLEHHRAKGGKKKRFTHNPNNSREQQIYNSTRKRNIRFPEQEGGTGAKR